MNAKLLQINKTTTSIMTMILFAAASLALVVMMMIMPSAAYAADFIEDFESYAPGTQIPAGWTYEYYILDPKTPEIKVNEVTNSTGDSVYRIHLGAVREWPASPSPGRATTGNLLSPVMEPRMQDFSLDIVGKNLYGSGAEYYTRGVVGYGIIYNIDNGIKSIAIPTHFLTEAHATLYLAYNNTRMGADITINDYATTPSTGTSLMSPKYETQNATAQHNNTPVPSVWKHVTNNAKTLYNDNGLGDYDSDVNGWILALGGSSYTSQINGYPNRWEGLYDNVRINSTAVFCGQPESFYNSTIRGTNSSEVLLGTAGSDLILGFGGNDFIRDLGGNDCIYAGDGDDFVQAGDGDDVIYAGNGTDAVQAGKGSDTVYAGNGDDFVQAGDGDDVIYAGNGTDAVWVGSGYDTVYGESGDDRLFANGGNNTIDGGAGNFDICYKRDRINIQMNATNCEITQ